MLEHATDNPEDLPAQSRDPVQTRVARAVPRARAATVDLSIVVPVLNEVESVGPLCEQITATMATMGVDYEVIVVDDGSTDGTDQALAAIADADSHIKVIELRRNFGQTAAMSAGFDHASGAVVVPMDGDLQNDPADIPRLLAKLDEGYDLVSGWRKDRHDSFTRKLPSRAANWLIGVVTGVRLHDYGCTLKAYRIDIAREIRLYGEMHRFLPALAASMGARIAELPVSHNPRMHGKSKYGMRRTFKVLLDLLTVRFLSSHGTKPLYVFGGGGLVLCFLGVVAAAYTLFEKFAYDVYVHRNPLILLAVFLFLLGVTFLLMGLLAELIVRTYHESQSKPIYWVRSSRNLQDPERGPTPAR